MANRCMRVSFLHCICQNNSLISWRGTFQFVTLAFRGRILAYEIPDRFHFFTEKERIFLSLSKA